MNTLNYQKRYYETLYTESINIDDTPLANILGPNPIKIIEFDIHHLEGLITLEELNEAIKI